MTSVTSDAVPLLRRTPPASSAEVDDDSDVDAAEAAAAARRRTEAKGRPTPKRSEARRARRQPVPKNRKEAEKLRREKAREQRQLQRQALLTGDERHLPPRDRGPARRLARDIVDSRFMLGQFALVLILVLFVLSTVRSDNNVFQLIVHVALLVATVLVLGQAWLVAREAHRRVMAEHGLVEARGIRGYVMMRSLTGRRMRRPPPKVDRGAKV